MNYFRHVRIFTFTDGRVEPPLSRQPGQAEEMVSSKCPESNIPVVVDMTLDSSTVIQLHGWVARFSFSFDDLNDLMAPSSSQV